MTNQWPHKLRHVVSRHRTALTIFTQQGLVAASSTITRQGTVMATLVEEVKKSDNFEQLVSYRG